MREKHIAIVSQYSTLLEAQGAAEGWLKHSDSLSCPLHHTNLFCRSISAPKDQLLHLFILGMLYFLEYSVLSTFPQSIFDNCCFTSGHRNASLENSQEVFWIEKR